jgi:sugar lactone lactonase YvrE
MNSVTANPPIYSANGAWVVKDKVLYGTSGINLTSPPGLYLLDLKSNISKPLLNNYRGLRFSDVDDLVVDKKGNILFTDVPFGYVIETLCWSNCSISI